MTLRLGNKKVCPTKLVKVNNVDWSKIGLQRSSYKIDSSLDNNFMANGSIWLRGSGEFYPRISAKEEWAVKCVNFSQPFEINVQFTSPTETDRASCIFGNKNYNQYCRSPECTYTAQDENNTFWFGLSTDGANWTYTQTFTPSEVPKLSAGETYIVNSKYNGTNWIVTVKWGGNNVATKSIAITGTPYYSSQSNDYGSLLCIGANANSSTILHGSYVYLGNTYIKQNDILVWGCENGQNYPAQELTTIYLVPNYTKTGSFTDTAGVVKTYGAAGYPVSTVKTPSSGTYEINVNFTTPTSVASDSPLVTLGDGDVFVNPDMHLCSWTGSAWAGGSTTLEYDKNYSFKFIRSDSESTIYLKEGLPSDNIIDYTQEYTITNYSDNSYIKFLVYRTNQFWAGTVDMKYCNLKRNNNILWEGCTKTIIS